MTAAFFHSARRWVAVVLLSLALPVASCASPLPTTAHVRRAVDGDTIELDDGRLVRYIGIDTPEVRRREGERWVEEPQPFGHEASEANRRLVEGKTVRLEYDAQPYDRYGRLLAYVYVEERLINAQLVEDGYAHLLTIPPNVKHAEEFRELAKRARANRRGLWAEPASRR